MTGGDLLISNVEIEGRFPLDVVIKSGRITQVGLSLDSRAERLDAKGGALIPGLVDHHLHLLSLAAQMDSLSLDGVKERAACTAMISAVVAGLPDGRWLRATGYHETTCGPLHRADLDKLAPNNPVRVQHQSGAFWQLNSQALSCVLGHEEAPACLERNALGALTGVVWRGDSWLRERIGRSLPPLGPVSATLSSFGITDVTDASTSTDTIAIRHMLDEKRSGLLQQNLCLMSEGEIPPSDDEEYQIGPVKIMLDDGDLPDFEVVTGRIATARRWGRGVAIHCVTAAELAFALAAFEASGSVPGDRIEHGGVISDGALQEIARRKLTVVTQSSFLYERGDRYLRDVESRDIALLYRAASILRAGVGIAGSSDAPYSSPDPWKGMRSAVLRRTRDGAALGENESLTPIEALRLYLPQCKDPAGPPKAIRLGMVADLCLLRKPLEAALFDLSSENVAATIIGGRIAYRAEAG